MVLQAQTDIFQSTLPREERLHLLRHCPFRWEFQSTLPREERPCRCEYQTTRCRFQSTLPREERRIKRVTLTVIILFQSTLPREERQAPAPAIVAPLAFQSTLPREERLKNPDMKYQHQLFQSTLPREERPLSTKTMAFAKGISIHAPTRGATLSNDVKSSIRYFNPRSHERSDHMSFVKSARHINRFQSTLPREERRTKDPDNCT